MAFKVINQKKLRGHDGCGHLQTILIFFRRRAQYTTTEKYQNLKGEIYGYFFFP